MRGATPAVDLADQLGLLRERDEVGGREEPPSRVQPANEWLCADDPQCQELDDRLEMQLERPGLDGIQQLTLESKPITAPLANRFVEELAPGPAAVLGVIRRRVARADQLLRRRVRPRKRDADVGLLRGTVWSALLSASRWTIGNPIRALEELPVEEHLSTQRPLTQEIGPRSR
jgi:hypothetical protein